MTPIVTAAIQNPELALYATMALKVSVKANISYQHRLELTEDFHLS